MNLSKYFIVFLFFTWITSDLFSLYVCSTPQKRQRLLNMGKLSLKSIPVDPSPIGAPVLGNTYELFYDYSNDATVEVICTEGPNGGSYTNNYYVLWESDGKGNVYIANGITGEASMQNGVFSFFNYIYNKETSLLGYPPLPGIDGVDPIYIVLLQSSKVGDTTLGYFDPNNETLDTFSNRREMIVFNISILNDFNELQSTCAHELQHLISFQATIGNNQSYGPTWLDESMSTLAEFLVLGNKRGPNEYMSRPNISLTIWNSDTALNTDYVLEDELANYAFSYLWGLYVYENYGGNDLLKKIIQYSYDGKAGINTAFSELGYSSKTFNSVFEDLKVALAIDTAGVFGFRNEEFAMPCINVSSYPHQSSEILNLKFFEIDYIKFTNGATGKNLTVRFNGIGDSSKDFEINSVVIRENGSLIVKNLSLDSANDGTFEVNDFNSRDIAYLLVTARQSEDTNGDASTYNDSGFNYSYSALLTTPGVDPDDPTIPVPQGTIVFTSDTSTNVLANSETVITYTSDAIKNTNNEDVPNGTRFIIEVVKGVGLGTLTGATEEYNETELITTSTNGQLSFQYKVKNIPGIVKFRAKSEQGTARTSSDVVLNIYSEFSVEPSSETGNETTGKSRIEKCFLSTIKYEHHFYLICFMFILSWIFYIKFLK